ncbi:MAG TPA: LLM class F420-dependent oxidoreductase [Candidatus Limnocylindrales bacterium]|nr:LLM class F420-dependent oxidoreductase [Candidatus Limnocylindrales bacterium]
MKFGLQVYSFSWPGGPEAIGPTLARAVRTADEVGFDSIWVMDHFWQIGRPGSEVEPMLEGWTTLGYMAAHTERARLGLMVGGVHYRHPGLWVKAATTLDVLSGGRAWLGIGAAWNQAESEGLGFPWPSQRERFERLEDTLQMAHGMWAGERGTEEDFQGHRYRATRLLNVPQSISRPRVPILIGGGGERRTLRLVAQYADASNLFGGPEQLIGKYQVLAAHCDDVGRDFAEIERTNYQPISLGRSAGSADQLVAYLGRLAEAGVQHVILGVADADDTAALERFGRDVLPQLRAVTAADPRRLAPTAA